MLPGATGERVRVVAIGIGATIGLFTITILSPILGLFCTFGIPLPTLICRAKLGRKQGALVPVASLLVLVFILGGISLDILYFLELLLIGYALSEAYELRVSIERTIGFTCLAALLTASIVIVGFSAASDTGIIALINGYVARNLEATLQLYQAKMSADQIRLAKESFEQIQFVFVRILPALTVMSTLLVTWTSMLLSRPLLKRLDLHFPDFGRLNQWKAPDPLVWAVIGCGLTLLIPATWIKLAGINGLLILLTVYFFQGIAILSYYFDRKRFPRFLRLLIYTLIALQQILVLVIVGIGFFDMWLNFRKLPVDKSTG